MWNSLLFDIRNENNPEEFKTKLEKHYWKIALHDTNESEEDSWSASTSDEYD